MAIPGIDNEELELIRKLRFEWKQDITANIKQAKAEGFVDPEAREKAGKVEKDLNTHSDAAAAASAAAAAAIKRCDDLDAKVKLYGERSSRPPGAGAGEDGVLVKSLGAKFVESDQFKNCQFSGRFQIQTGLTKTRIKDIMAGILGRKAVTTIAEGGATTITPPVGAYPIFPRRMGLIPQQFAPVTMRDLVDVVPIDGTNAVEYVTEVWTNAADYQILEGDKKAQSGVTYTDNTAVVRTIAHYVKVSRQMASDVSFIIATIENRLALFVLLKEDTEILFGNNAAGHLWGIMPQATAATVYYPGPAPATDTMLDQLNAAETYIENQFYFPTAYVLNPTNWFHIESLKTTYGQYLLPSSPMNEGTPRLWGLPVITTPVMTLNDYLCGAFPGNAALFDRETVNVEMAFQNEDDFIRNLITLRAEERIAFAVFVPKAFAKGPFVTAALGALGSGPSGPGTSGPGHLGPGTK
jgi:HK97 family phage major capsid protein